MKQPEQKLLFESGNELAAYAAKQINYHVMGYYPITPSTQIAEFLDQMGADGEHNIALIPAEGEHSAAGICYGAASGGGRVFNATSANGLLYALEQLPVQSGTRLPMVLNVACRTVSGPLSIKGDHSDLMYTLNTGWVILFADSPQEVYDCNICAVKIAEKLRLPAIVAFDGFFTSHQKRNCYVFADDEIVQKFIGPGMENVGVLDPEHPVTIGSYMNEPDLLNNKYQLHLAMEKARTMIPEVFSEYEQLSGRTLSAVKAYQTEDAEVLMFVLGSAYLTAKAAVDKLRKDGKKVGVFTLGVLRPFPTEEVSKICKNARIILVADRQDSYGAGGGNMSLEIRAALQQSGLTTRVLSRVYGLGGRDFYEKDAISLFETCYEQDVPAFDYIAVDPGEADFVPKPYFAPISEETASGLTVCSEENGKVVVKGGTVRDTTARPKRLAPGHGACPGCGIPVNVNLLLRGIEGNVVLLFQTGCGMVVTTGYPKTAFRVPYVHNLFQNGAATLAGVAKMYHQRQERGELPPGDITFIMVSGDGGMDIGMGSALGTALRGDPVILFEYDNGGYMNTGYQLSYSTPMGAKSATSHLGSHRWGKEFFHKDMPRIMAATGMPYVATAAESDPADFIRKAAKAQYYAKNHGTAYIKCLSACPLNWGDKPNTERKVISAAVNSCYFPLYEVEQGCTTISYNPEQKDKKIPVEDWLKMMGRTKHLCGEKYKDVREMIQQEVDRRWQRLKAQSEHHLL
ncbi:MAG: pyruvate synthase [Clostridia bacterium]|nr:pyruvate synthase [Clostridia bacterium]MBQ7046470.1 pyruvate synthase [Oscillospiraceae bacterium]